MGEQELSPPPPADDEYFSLLFGNFLRQVKEINILPDRLEEIGELVRGLSNDELTGERPTEVARIEGLTEQEKDIFSSLIQARREIGQAEEKGKLSPEDVDKWRERFGFNEGGKILKTGEEIIEEFSQKLQGLELIESQLGSAEEEERASLQERKEGIETIIEAIQSAEKETR